MRLALVVDKTTCAKNNGWGPLERRYADLLRLMGVLGDTMHVVNHHNIEAAPDTENDGHDDTLKNTDTICREIKAKGADGAVLLLPHEQCAQYASALLRKKLHVFAAVWPLPLLISDVNATKALQSTSQQKGVMFECGRVYAQHGAGSSGRDGSSVHDVQYTDAAATYNYDNDTTGCALARMITCTRGRTSTLEIHRRDDDDDNHTLRRQGHDSMAASATHWCNSDYDCDFGNIMYRDNDDNSATIPLNPLDMHAANLLFGSAPSMVFARAGVAEHDDDGNSNTGENHTRIILGYGKGRTAVLSTDMALGCSRALRIDATFCCGNCTAGADLVTGDADCSNVCDDNDVKIKPDAAGSTDTRLLSLALENFIDTIKDRDPHKFTNIKSAIAASKAAKASLLSSRRGIPLYLDL